MLIRKKKNILIEIESLVMYMFDWYLKMFVLYIFWYPLWSMTCSNTIIIQYYYQYII